MTHTICNSDLFERPGCKDSAETITRMLEDNIRIIDLCKDSVLFPDNAHPGGAAHKSLFEKIIDYIK
jgi:phospholipase/lecithinase/hemolysin